MGLFSSKECQECLVKQDEIDTLLQRNKQLEKVLRRLKEQYEALQVQNNTVNVSADEVTILFKKIKNSSYSQDTKRYLRSVLMLIKETGESSLYQFLLVQLKAH